MKPWHILTIAALTTGSLTPQSAFSSEISSDISKHMKPATMKVLLGKQTNDALIEAKGRFMVYNPFNDVLVSQGTSSERHFLSCSELGLQWGETFPGLFQLRFVPGDTQSSLLVNGVEYRGCIEVYDIQGALYIINEVDIERYLKSTLATQFTQELHSEVMDAIAIAARTNAYQDRKSTRLNSSHIQKSRMPSSA